MLESLAIFGGDLAGGISRVSFVKVSRVESF